MKKFKKGLGKIKRNIQAQGVKHIIFNTFLIIMIAIASMCLLFALYIIISAPNFDKDKLYSKESSIFYYKDGSEMARVGQANRELVSFNDLPQVYVDALISVEDSRFFQHNGLDIARFLKASFYQLIGRPGAGGASTLTMQLVKNHYTDDTAHGIKGIIRKFTDIYMAVFKIENSYTKEEIIEFYVNSQWFGNDGSLNYAGIEGVETASKYFFGKSISEVTLAEASILAGMYQNARILNPYTNPEGVRKRQETVLKLMVSHGYITNEEKDAVLAIPVESLLRSQDRIIKTTENQAVIEYIKDEVEAKTGKSAFQTPMKVYTTIEKDKQKVLNDLENGLLDIGQGKKFTWKEKAQEGTVVTSVKDGSVVAMSGGREYGAGGNHRALSTRNPGSTAKPMFDYAPYIEYLNGSTGDYLFDEPYTYSNGTPITDADDKYEGMITLRQSLVGSRNVTALQTFQKVMASDSSLIPNLVHKFGIDFGDTLYEAHSIGGGIEASPLQLSAAYAVFGRGGYYIEPYVFTKVIYEDDTSYEYKPSKEKIISEETAYMVTSMLIDAKNSIYGFPANVTGTEIAAKTGTTNLSKDDIKNLGVPVGTIPDSWSCAYSPEYSISLWYGYDKITPEFHMNTDEGWSARTNIMNGLAKKIFSTNKTFSRPSGVVSVEVEKYTIPLQLPSENTPTDMRMNELFKEGTEPTEVSQRYAKLDSPTNGRYSVNGSTVTITWDKIDNPRATDSEYLSTYFNNNYGKFAQQYYEKRISENNSQFGSIGYHIYQRLSSGALKDLGWFSNNKFTMSIEYGEDYTFVVKAAYANFKANESDGLIITVKDGDPGSYIDDEDEDEPSSSSGSSSGKPNTSLD